MRRLVPWLSLLLLTLWVPATQHCALEAVGLIPQTCSDDCLTGDKGDGCGSVEGSSYKPAGATVRVAAPELTTCLDVVFTSLLPAEPAVREISPHVALARPRDWVATWRFARRAAPSPRAPSAGVA